MGIPVFRMPPRMYFLGLRSVLRRGMPGFRLRRNSRAMPTLMVWERVVPRAAPAGPKWKAPINKYIYGTGDSDKIHGTFGIAQSAENGTDDIIGGNKGNSHKAYGKIARSSGSCGFRRGHSRYNGIDEKEQENRQQNGQDQKQGYGISDAAGSAFFSAGSHCLCNADCGTHCKSYNDYCEHVHHLTAD